MPYKKIVSTILVLIFALWVGPRSHAQVQDGHEIHIKHTAVSETDVFTLQAYFEVRDEAGQLNTQTAVSGLRVMLEDGESYPAEVTTPPFYLTLIIDTSGSMEAALADVQTFATRFIEAAPDNVYISIITFNESIQFVQAFNNDKIASQRALNQITTQDKGTCLLNAVNTAVLNTQQNAGNTPQQAVLLFADGFDEITFGQNNPCSASTFETLAATADSLTLPVPVYTIGMAGNNNRINKEALTQIANLTQGEFIEGTKEDVQTFTTTLTEQIKATWLATTTPYLLHGWHTATLYPGLANGAPITPASLLFIANQDYPAPLPPPPPTPEPVAIQLVDTEYLIQDDAYLLQIEITSGLAQAHALQVDVLDVIEGRQLYYARHDEIGSEQTITLPADTFQSNHLYLTKIYPLNADGYYITRNNGNIVFAETEFLHQRPLLDIVSVRLETTVQNNQETSQLIITQKTQNVGNESQLGVSPATYSGTLLNQETQQAEQSFRYNDLTGYQEVTVPLAGIPTSNDYQLRLNLLTGDGQPIASDTYDFTLPLQPTISPLWALLSNPTLMLFVMLLLLIALIIGWLIGSLLARQRQWVPAMATTTTAKQPYIRAKTVLNGTTQSPIIEQIDNFPYTIGRADCHLNIPADQSVSRRHAQIIQENGRFQIIDLNSSAGTYINNQPIAANTPIPLALDNTQQVRLGRGTYLEIVMQEE